MGEEGWIIFTKVEYWYEEREVEMNEMAGTQ